FARPTPSPDGSRVAFLASADGASTFDLFVLDRASGARTTVEAGPETTTAVAWSPDGQRLAFVSFDQPWGGDGRLSVFDVASGSTAAVDSFQALAATPRFSPDGTRIAYGPWDPDSGAATLRVVGLDGGAPRILRTESARVGVLDWSPDGQMLA